MATFATAFANLRISNKESKRVCAVTNVSPTVSADTAAALHCGLESLNRLELTRVEHEVII